MGIDRRLADAIVREHAWKPIKGDVLLIARQTMFFSPQDATGMLRAAGIDPPDVPFGADTQTRGAQSRYIRDDDFFRLLGVERIKALDVSDYEGADIIQDLNEPIATELEGVADFILDGSTLDNVFDPATALRNFARMLKPGGRLVSISAASNHYDPYIMLTPLWIFDYFAVNHFADCKVYVCVYDGPKGEMNVFTPDLSLLRGERPQLSNFTSGHSMGAVLIAEKARHSTWARTPVQHQYRGAWREFDAGLTAIAASDRPDHVRSTEDCFIARDGWLFVDPHGARLVARKREPARFAKRAFRWLIRRLT